MNVPLTWNPNCEAGICFKSFEYIVNVSVSMVAFTNAIVDNKRKKMYRNIIMFNSMFRISEGDIFDPLSSRNSPIGYIGNWT